MQFKNLLFLCLSIVLLGACSKEEPEVLIQQYLDDNNLTAEKTDEGVYVIIDVPGTGKRPTISDNVTVHYHGELLNGDVFDSSINRGTPAEFPLNGVIRAWQIGIPYFKEGGKGKLICPPDLAYGSNPPPGIPKNAVLVFDVELIKVK